MSWAKVYFPNYRKAKKNEIKCIKCSSSVKPNTKHNLSVYSKHKNPRLRCANKAIYCDLVVGKNMTCDNAWLN